VIGIRLITYLASGNPTIPPLERALAMKRNRTTRQLLSFESLETRQLMAGLTTPVVAPPARLPAPTTIPAVIAKPTTTSLAAPIVDTTALQTSKLVGTPLLTQTQDLGTLEPKSPGSSLVNNEPLAGNPLDKLPSDPTSELAGPESRVGDDDFLAVFDLDAFFNQLARSAPDVYSRVTAGPASPAPQPGSTRWGGVASLYSGGSETMVGGNATRPILVEYEEGKGITNINDGMDDQEQSEFRTWVLDFIGWKDYGGTPTSEAHKQAEEQERQLEGDGASSNSSGSNSTGSNSGESNSSSGNSNNGSTSNENSGESNTESTTTTQDSSDSDADSNPVVKQWSTDDGSTHYFVYADDTMIIVDFASGKIITVLPDGTKTSENLAADESSSSPSTPPDDEPPPDPWVQEILEQIQAEIRAAQNYQAGGGDIDWGDFDTAGGYLVALGAVIDLIATPCGDSVRPETIDQGEFQQPDQGNVDPNPNDDN
jgi:hypothetical protein